MKNLKINELYKNIYKSYLSNRNSEFKKGSLSTIILAMLDLGYTNDDIAELRKEVLNNL